MTRVYLMKCNLVYTLKNVHHKSMWTRCYLILIWKKKIQCWFTAKKTTWYFKSRITWWKIIFLKQLLLRQIWRYQSG